VSGRTARVSCESGRWLRELALAAAADDPHRAIGAVLADDRAPVDENEEQAVVTS
jgi:hypothetical protein